MTQITQFPFVSVSGAPEARGRSYGQQAADRVRKSAAMYGQTLVSLGYDAMARGQLIQASRARSSNSRRTTWRKCAASPPAPA